MVNNINNLTICKDNNEVDLELCCEEVMEDASIAESANKLSVQS